jgi:hypothetical protein
MATHPHMLHDAHPRIRAVQEARTRRLCWLALTGAVLLALYVGGLAWAAREVEAGVARSVQPLPMAIRDNPALD